MSQENKDVVTRWFGEYWGKGNPDVVDELGAELQQLGVVPQQ